LRLFLVLGKEEHADRKRLAGTQTELALVEQVLARNRRLHADTVAALAISGNRAAMRKAPKSSQGQSKNFVFGASVKGRDESYAAGFVLEAGVEEVAPARRKATTTHSPLYMESAV
jgi:hypothetical protein